MTQARTITHALGGRWHGRYGTAACPVCQPERRRDQNALTLADSRDGGLLAHCHKAGCGFTEILAAAGIAPGRIASPDPIAAAQRAAARDAEDRADRAKRTAQARRLWAEARPVADTLGECYLRARAVRGPLPPVLRFHSECWHGPTARRLPALVAAVTLEGEAEPVAVHRTFLCEPGRKAFEGRDAKLSLGPVAGGAVRLSDGDGPLVLGEGLETCLSLADALAAHRPRVWAALSTSGVAGLRLPARAGELVVAPDGDPAGRKAADALARRAYAAGWRVSVMEPPGDGLDWNHVAMSQCRNCRRGRRHERARELREGRAVRAR